MVFTYGPVPLRGKGLVTNNGEVWGGGGVGLQNSRRGVGRQVKFYPYKRGGGGVELVLSMLKGGGGHTKFWGNYLFNSGA